MTKVIYLLFIILLYGCTENPKIEKHYKRDNNIIYIKDKIKEIKLDNILIGGVIRLYPINEYLIIEDYKSLDKQIHIFNKKEFKYITSIAKKGQGPGEVANIGYIGIDEVNRRFYVSDHGKQKIFIYQIDSIILNPSYMPQTKMKMDEKLFPSEYTYINDTLCIGRIIKPIGNTDYKPFIAKWNMNTEEIKPMKYENKKIEKKRINFALSKEYSIYAECYNNYDLITICDINGNLRYNIYGPNWSYSPNKNSYYNNAIFCKDRLVVSFIGDDKDSYLPNKLIVFNTTGDYIKTLKTGYNISNFCFDKENNRIIMSLVDTIQLAYLDLNEILN